MPLVLFGGRRALTVAEPEHREEEQAFDHDEHADRPPEDPGEQLVDIVPEVGNGRQRRLRKGPAARGEQCQAENSKRR